MANGTRWYFNFATTTRYFEDYLTYKPDLSCSWVMDRFTVDSANGNGDLTYPIATITFDELVLSGMVPYNYRFEVDRYD